MKHHTWNWLAGLDPHDRKEVVSLLFTLRSDVKSDKSLPSHWFPLFEGLLRAVDDDYHALKP